MDPLSEAVVRIIRTSGGRISALDLSKKLVQEGLHSDVPNAADALKRVVGRVARTVVNQIDGEMIALRPEYQ